MSWFSLNYILQSHILLLILLGLYHILLKRETSFKFNRVYLLVIGFFALIVPLIDVPVASSSFVSLPSINSVEPPSETIPASNAKSETSLWGFVQTTLPYLYLSVVLLMLTVLFLRLLKTYNKVQQIRKQSQFDFRRYVYVSEKEIEPFTFFADSFISKVTLNKPGAQLIIKHERTHARENHSYDIIVAEVINCLLFLNPFKKIYLKLVAENHEYLADATITQKKINKEYASLLINLTLQREGLPIVSFFAKPTILNRIEMMKRTKKSRINQVVASSFTLLLVLMFACDFQEEEITIQEVQVKDLNTVNTEDLGDKVFTIVEDQAEPVNGIQAFYDKVGEFLEGNYPQQAQNLGIEGVVFVQFVIEKDGSLSNIKPVKGIGGGCDELAVKAIAATGNWIAGMQNGKVVRSQRIVPIRFRLENDFIK